MNINIVCRENRNEQQHIRSAPPPLCDRWIIVSIDGCIFMVIQVNGEGNMLSHAPNVLTHDLACNILK